MSKMDKGNEVIQWIDPAIDCLKDDDSSIEAQIDNLENERTELQKTIHLFDLRNTSELGDLVLRILNMKRRVASEKVKEQPDNNNYKDDYEQATKDESEFKETYDDVIRNPIPKLTSDEASDLKQKRNRIAKLIHEDKGEIVEQFIEEAGELMRKTNEAYKNNDVKTINEILDYVESGKTFMSVNENSSEAEILLAKIKYKKTIVIRLQSEINKLKSTETYQIISRINNWDDYFANTRLKFKTELEYLEKIEQ